MSRSNGRNYFKRTFFRYDFIVKFEEYLNKIVFCRIVDKYFDKKFLGVAIKHPDDKWSLKEGRDVAFGKAMQKRSDYYNKIIKQYERYKIDSWEHLTNVEKLAYNRFKKMQEKTKE